MIIVFILASSVICLMKHWWIPEHFYVTNIVCAYDNSYFTNGVESKSLTKNLIKVIYETVISVVNKRNLQMLLSKYKARRVKP